MLIRLCLTSFLVLASTSWRTSLPSRATTTAFTKACLRRVGVCPPKFFSSHEDETAKEIWSQSYLPNDYVAVESMMVNALRQSLQWQRTSRMSLDVLTPGLNPKLEEKAILLQDLLFDLILSIIPVINSHFTTIKLVFQSAGDAAGFQKYCALNRVVIPPSIALTDMGSKNRMDKSMDCVVYIAAKNSVGDPVVNDIQEVCEKFTQATFVFLNCDLSQKVTVGLQERAIRDGFRESIQPVFYFRNIVEMLRPSLIPIETGAVMFRPNQGWSVYIVNEEDIQGPGSLNRFMKQPTFARHPDDPTALNPPRSISAGTFKSMPSREDIGKLMAKAAFLNAKLERDELASKARIETAEGQLQGIPMRCENDATSLIISFIINRQARDTLPPAVALLRAFMLLENSKWWEQIRSSSTATSLPSLSLQAQAQPHPIEQLEASTKDHRSKDKRDSKETSSPEQSTDATELPSSSLRMGVLDISTGENTQTPQYPFEPALYSESSSVPWAAPLVEPPPSGHKGGAAPLLRPVQLSQQPTLLNQDMFSVFLGLSVATTLPTPTSTIIQLLERQKHTDSKDVNQQDTSYCFLELVCELTVRDAELIPLSQISNENCQVSVPANIVRTQLHVSATRAGKPVGIEKKFFLMGIPVFSMSFNVAEFIANEVISYIHTDQHKVTGNTIVQKSMLDTRDGDPTMHSSTIEEPVCQEGGALCQWILLKNNDDVLNVKYTLWKTLPQ